VFTVYLYNLVVVVVVVVVVAAVSPASSFVCPNINLRTLLANYVLGRAIAQAVSRRLPTAAARV
jgi:hypothetical protein